MTSKSKNGLFSLFFGHKPARETRVPDWDQESDQEDVIYPYRVNKRFLSPAEHSFYLVAQKVLGDRYALCPQVPLSSIFFVDDKRTSYTAFNRIARKRVDFIICDAVTMKILFGIELDDSSHQKSDRIARDIFVNRVFEEAGLRLLHVRTRESYHTGELKELFSDALGLRHEDTPFMPEIGVKAVEPEPTPKYEFCPNCGAPFKIRESIKGPNVGHKFFVCGRYPECKTVIKID